MSLIAKLLVSLAVAAVVSTLTTVLSGGDIPDLALLGSFCLATVATALLVSWPWRPTPPDGLAQSTGAARSGPAGGDRRPGASGPSREQGKVKWFNVSKGFGFIIKDDGEEIFVHFRSIRGEGRRGLRDGQRVSFIVAQSDKGPQAEDVEGID